MDSKTHFRLSRFFELQSDRIFKQKVEKLQVLLVFGKDLNSAPEE